MLVQQTACSTQQPVSLVAARRCKLRRRAAAALAQGLRTNRTLRQLNLAGIRGLDEAGAVALADAVAHSKALTALNLAFVNLSEKAVDAVTEVGG
jgi:ABC-type transporter Mla MlaB component